MKYDLARLIHWENAPQEWTEKIYLIYFHPFWSLDFCTSTEKRTLKCPVPFTVTIVTEVFFCSKIFPFDVY
jgi:hypothetical protein